MHKPLFTTIQKIVANTKMKKITKPKNIFDRNQKKQKTIRERKLKYLIYLFALMFSFSTINFVQSTSALQAPSDAKGKNVVKEEKTCPKGKYLNPKTKRCNKIPEQKVKTCPKGYFLNVKTYRCNKIPVKKPSSKTNQNHSKSGNQKPQNQNSQNKPKQSSNRPSSLKTCSPGYVLNPATKRCNKIKSQISKTCPAGYFLNKITNRCNKNQTTTDKKPCKSDQVRNPKTGRCHKVAATTGPKTCPEGKILNPVTNRCKNPEKEHELKPCKEGYERHPETNRCRKKHQNTGAENPVEVPELGNQDKKNEKKDFNGAKAVAGSAVVGLGIAIFQFKNEILVIIRKIFFHK